EEAWKRSDDRRRGNREDGERDHVRAELVTEQSLPGGARQVWHDNHPERLRAQHEHEVDAVRGHEAVRANVAPELVCEVGTGDGRGTADHQERQPGERPALYGAPAAFRATLQLLVRGHRSMKSDRHDSPWTDGELADLQREVGEFFAGRTCVITGADGFMGSHLTDALVHLE